MNIFNDLEEQNLEEQYHQLLQDLRRLYPPQTNVNQSITRVKQQLFRISENEQGIETSTLQNEITLPDQPPVREPLHFPIYTPRPPHYRLNAIAAIIFVTLLVGSLVTLFTIARHNTSGSISPTTHYPDAGISGIHMIDQSTGWAFDAGRIILRTTDGGIHWKDVSPLEINQQSLWGETTIIDAYSAWIATTPNKTQSLIFNPTSTTYIFHTTNAGRTWQKTSIPTSGEITDKLVFLDANNGWLLTKLEQPTHLVTGPEHYSPPELFHTTDGGRTWVKILNQAGVQAHQFNDVYITGMGFADPQNGWITGASFFPTSTVTLFATHDGGITWQEQQSILPQVMHHTMDHLGTPHFFTAQDGVIPAFYTGSPGIDFYVTHDGGNTWKSTPFLPVAGPLSALKNVSPKIYDPIAPPLILDAKHWWVVGYQGGEKMLFTTNNGGQHWTNIHITNDPAPDSFGVPAFSSSSTGWFLGYTSLNQKTQVQYTVLFRTTDGGHSWQQVHAIFPDFITPKSAF